MRISGEGKVGILLALLALAGGGALAVAHGPLVIVIGWVLIAVALIGGCLLAHNHFERRRVLPLIGMIVSVAVFVGFAAWDFWPQEPNPAAPSRPKNPPLLHPVQHMADAPAPAPAPMPSHSPKVITTTTTPVHLPGPPLPASVQPASAAPASAEAQTPTSQQTQPIYLTRFYSRKQKEEIADLVQALVLKFDPIIKQVSMASQAASGAGNSMASSRFRIDSRNPAPLSGLADLNKALKQTVVYESDTLKFLFGGNNGEGLIRSHPEYSEELTAIISAEQFGGVNGTMQIVMPIATDKLDSVETKSKKTNDVDMLQDIAQSAGPALTDAGKASGEFLRFLTDVTQRAQAWRESSSR
jgi:hypothetical protein